ncbi:prepilin peptidase [Fluviicola sp.]|uniref:prepilin peptidase n=1 Tax=Fluviicola sp. TaxID=1917219 RepID=UPI003D2B5334
MILLAVILILVSILYQDFRYREIWWFTPPLLLIGGLIYNWETLNWQHFLFNFLFISVVISFLVVYVRIRFKSSNLFKDYFGLGDVLVLLAITPLFGFPFFIYFFTCSTIISLIGYLLFSLFKAQKSIPYAGYISLCTIAFLLLVQYKITPFIYPV